MSRAQDEGHKSRHPVEFPAGAQRAGSMQQQHEQNNFGRTITKSPEATDREPSSVASQSWRAQRADAEHKSSNNGT